METENETSLCLGEILKKFVIDFYVFNIKWLGTAVVKPDGKGIAGL